MKSVLIVEDERMIRDGLSALIEREVDYCCVAGVCKNGKEALAFLRKKRVDIVISDISMPEMSGIEMIETLNAADIGGHPLFILISGYAEFEYARKALQLNVFDYVLKPIDFENFFTLLRAASDSIDRKSRLDEDMSAHLGIMIAHHAVTSKESIRAAAKSANFSLENITAISLSFKETKPSGKEDDRVFYSESLVFLQKKLTRSFLFFPDDDSYALLLSGEKAPLDLLKIWGAFVVSKFKRLLTFGVGPTVKSYIDAPASYRLAREARLSSIYYENTDDKAYAFVYHMTWPLDGETDLWKQNEPRETILVLRRLNFKDAAEHISGIVTEARENFYEPSALMEYTKKILRSCASVVTEVERSQMELDGEAVIFRMSHNTLSLRDLEAFLHSIAEKAINALFLADGDSFSPVVSQVVHHIHTCYHLDITLEDICSKFHVNKSYFCKIFKRQTGDTFGSYVTGLRIEKAKALLRHGKHNITEIAELVGYREVKYFTRLFHERTGMTPSGYRKSCEV